MNNLPDSFDGSLLVNADIYNLNSVNGIQDCSERIQWNQPLQPDLNFSYQNFYSKNYPYTNQNLYLQNFNLSRQPFQPKHLTQCLNQHTSNLCQLSSGNTNPGQDYFHYCSTEKIEKVIPVNISFGTVDKQANVNFIKKIAGDCYLKKTIFRNENATTQSKALESGLDFVDEYLSRPPTHFNIFSKEQGMMMKNLSNKNPRSLKDQWKTMSNQAKDKYIQKAIVAKKVHTYISSKKKIKSKDKIGALIHNDNSMGVLKDIERRSSYPFNEDERRQSVESMPEKISSNDFYDKNSFLVHLFSDTNSSI